MLPSASTLKKEIPSFETRITPATLKEWPNLSSKFVESAALHNTPGKSEPEYKFIVPSKDKFKGIIQALANHPDIHIGPDYLFRPKDYILLSFGMETIDNEGNPTYSFLDNKFQYRNRMAYRPNIAKKSSRFDNIQANMKDLMGDKAGIRDELEAMIPFHDIPEGLNHGVKYLINELESEGTTPPSFLYQITDSQLAVGELCMSSRAQFNFIHKLPHMNCAVIYETCADSQIFSTPKADKIVGSDYEFEIEAKYIFCPGCAPSDKKKMEILKTSLEMIKPIITGTDTNIYMSVESKLQRAARAVSDYYKSKTIIGAELLTPGRDPGRDFALRFNMQASDILYAKAAQLQALLIDADRADTLVSKEWLVNSGDMGYSRAP